MKAIVDNKAILGSGIFTIKDVSSILTLPAYKVRRVLNDFWDVRFDLNYSWGEGREKAINFYTLIEFYTFYQLKNYGVSTSKILQAHIVLSEKYNTKYPFASSNIITDGNNVLFTPEIGQIIKADKTLQYKFYEIIAPFCNKIDFGNDLLAEKFYPKGKKIEVVIDPHHQFGQPTINNSNILAETIYKMFVAGEDKHFISDIYKITNKEVDDAIFYFQNAA